MGVTGQQRGQVTFTPWRRLGGPRAGLDAWEMRKLCSPCLDSNPGSPSQWPSHYTDNAILLQVELNMAVKCTLKPYKFTA